MDLLIIVAAIGAVAIGFITALVPFDLFGQLQLPLGVTDTSPVPRGQKPSACARRDVRSTSPGWPGI